MRDHRRELSLLAFLTAALGASSIRVVQVPRGPLYRVEGTHVFIPCNVTQAEGTDRLVFRWDFVKAETERETPIAVVSTQDSGYPDARYQARVRAGEIYIHRLSRTSAQLHLTHLQRGDQGQYQCKVGTRTQLASSSAKVELKVLRDTLRLSGPSVEGGRLELREGEGLALRCRAETLSAPHTHLALAFRLDRSGDGGLDTVVGVGPELRLEGPGTGPHRARFLRGQVGLEKVKGGAYRLRVDHVKPQDAGLYLCTAGEWIQDPDRGWHRMVEKTISLVELIVRANDLRLGAVASLAPSKFYRGDTVELHCNVTLGVGPGDEEEEEEEEEEPRLAVGWWGQAQEPLALVDRGGVSVPTSWQGRTPAGSVVSADRPAPLCFRLRLHRASKGDEGPYHCLVTSWGRRRGSAPYLLASAQSQPVTLFLYLSPSDTLLIPLSVGAALSLSIAIAIIATVTCCFLRRLAKR